MTRDADTVFDILVTFQKDARGARYVTYFIESKAKLLRLDLDLWRMTSQLYLYLPVHDRFTHCEYQ
jgi:hypothetical protein